MQPEENVLEKLTIFDEFKSKCRVCLCKCNEHVNIFSFDVKCGKIWESLMECCSVYVDSLDRLPSIICLNCLENLRRAYEFRSLCRLSDQTLRQYLNFISSQSSKLDENNSTTISTLTSPQNIIITNATCVDSPQILIITDPNVTNATASLEPNTTVINPLESHTPVQINTISLDQPLTIQDISNNINTSPALIEVKETKNLSTNVKKRKKKILEKKLKSIPASRSDLNKTGKFCCRICFKRYGTDRQLIRHETISHGERRFQCNACGRKFAEKSVLKSHTMAIHTGDRPYKCQFCDKSYIAKNHLRIHLLAHTGIRPFACDICHKTFTHKNVLRHHKTLHTGQGPYTCTICSKRFIRLSVLTKHTQTVHTKQEANEMSKSIHDVDVQTKSQCKLRPYECFVCHKRFYRKEHLDRHTSSHTGERPFKCDVCDKGFVRKWDVKRHMIVHKRGPTVIVPQNVVDAVMQQINTS